MRKTFREVPALTGVPIWHEGNVTFGYLSTLNTWAKEFNFLLLLEESYFGSGAAELSRGAGFVREAKGLRELFR